MNLRVPQKVRNFFTAQATFGFPRKGSGRGVGSLQIHTHIYMKTHLLFNETFLYKFDEFTCDSSSCRYYLTALVLCEWKDFNEVLFCYGRIYTSGCDTTVTKYLVIKECLCIGKNLVNSALLSPCIERCFKNISLEL